MAGGRRRHPRWHKVAEMCRRRDMAMDAPCANCHGVYGPIDYMSKGLPLSYEADHILPVKDFPELELDMDNVQPSHMYCNRARGAGGRNDLGARSRDWTP